MPKPICIIYFPDLFDVNNNRNWIYDYMRALNGEENKDSKTNYKLSHDYSDYHWFCFYKDEITEPEFKVFYEKDFTQIKFDELKQIVSNSIEKYKNEKVNSRRS